MRRRLSITAIVAVVLAVGGGALAAANSDDQASDDRGQVIKLFTVTPENGSADLDLGAKGESLGDRFVFTDDVFREKGGEQVGTTGGECVIVRLDADAQTVTVQCVATLSLDNKGQIASQGLVTFSASDTTPTFTLPVTGGSGDFKGTDGEVVVEEVSATEANVTLFLD